MPSLTPPVDALAREFESLREQARSARGAARWRALERLGDDPRFDAWLRREHPQLATMAAMNRRDFLRYAAASLALAGVAACSRPPEEEIVPMRVGPEASAIGEPRFYASAISVDGDASGVLVESHDGRPTKIEGNPLHPASLGSTDAFAQAAVLDVWDPDRSQTVRSDGRIATWDEAFAAMLDAAAQAEAAGGEGLHLLTGAIASPSLRAQIGALQQRFPRLRHHVWQAWPRDHPRAGARRAFGRPLEPVWRVADARIIVALDADFLGREPGHVRHARDFADGRRIEAGRPPRMNRLYVAEPSETLSGAMADHRLACAARDVARLAQALAAGFGIGEAPPLPDAARRWVAGASADLAAHRGAALLIAGEAQPPAVHALVATLNARLAAPLDYRDADADEPALDALTGLTAELRAGRVRTLLMLDVNPVYDAPVDLQFGDALRRAAQSFHLGLYADETAHASRWHLPQAHALESWSDARAYDGTISLVQPLMAPLYEGRSAHEVLAVWLGQADANGFELLRDYWRTRSDGDFETFWRRGLRTGIVARDAPRPPDEPADAVPIAATAGEHDERTIELVFRPDPNLGDGRFANNGWLQELPKPGTQLSWGNAVLVSPSLAAELKLADGDEVRLRLDGREARGPVRIAATQAARSVTVFLGHGRTHAGRIGNGVGFDANALRTHAAFWFADGLQITATGRRQTLAAVQPQQRLDEREPVRRATLAELIADASVIGRPGQDGPFPSLYPERPPGEYAWGMSIDLNVCTGCNVCTIACQAENNIPVVGAAQVAKGRVMHWIRVDRYEDERRHVVHQPVPCMHCEHAPCELVCPVGATVHDADGLNLQVYNRCIGTRFCANNCPYKVRRFNFLQFSDTTSESLKGQRNPDVSVRNRGVMEKCTYCIQRIRVAEIAAEKEHRKVRDGEIRTACEGACPTQAIRFGDLRDPASAVSRAKASPLHYVLLAPHNTRPRTSYLAKLTNPRDAAADGEGNA
jgi:molybdopterin-containing oxidoreductase family iron-sulfur binding subunit